MLRGVPSLRSVLSIVAAIFLVTPAVAQEVPTRLAQSQVGQSDHRQVADLPAHQERVNSVAFSPDGKRFVSASNDKVALIWSSAGEKLVSLTGHTGPVRFASFSPDGNLVVTGSEDNTARVWDATSGKELFALSGHDAPLNAAAFSNDGKRIVTASGDDTARVWDFTTRKTVQILRHTDPVMSAAFSRNDSFIVTAGGMKKCCFGIRAAAGRLRVWLVTRNLFSVPHFRWTARRSRLLL